jgi:hypothetical protein
LGTSAIHRPSSSSSRLTVWCIHSPTGLSIHPFGAAQTSLPSLGLTAETWQMPSFAIILMETGEDKLPIAKDPA